MYKRKTIKEMMEQLEFMDMYEEIYYIKTLKKENAKLKRRLKEADGTRNI